MKTNSELQAELDSALRAVTSLAAERNAARAEAEDLRGRLAQDHGIIAGMEEGANELNEVNDNLVLLLRRTSRRLPPFDPLRVQTVDYLKRIGQAGNELRGVTAEQDADTIPASDLTDMKEAGVLAGGLCDLESVVEVLKNHRDQVRWEKRERLAHALDAGLIAIAALEDIERDAEGALNCAFEEEAPDIIQNLHTRAAKALKALCSPNIRRSDTP